MTDRFIELIQDKINEYYTCYYEEADPNTSFPYLVIPTLTLNPIDSGFSGLFDIEIYVNELSKVSVEEIMDKLRDNLDGYSYYEKGLGFHIGFDNQLLVKSNEQDLSMRRITFEARLFR